MKKIVFTLTRVLFVATIFAQTNISAKQNFKNADTHCSSSCSSCCENCLDPIYACGHSEVLQTLPVDTFTPIEFEVNIFPPVGIVHPVLGDATQFQVTEAGIYLIEWHMDLYRTDSGSVNVLIQLNNVSTSTAIFSSMQQINIMGDRVVADAGQTLVELSADSIIDLEVNPSTTAVEITNPTLTITRIA